MANTVFNKAWIDGFLNQTDSSKRFYPMANSGGLRNFKTERADPIMQEFDAGGKIFIRDAVRNNQFLVTGSAATPRNEGIINGFRCHLYGIYIIDRGNNIGGILSSAVGNCDTCNCNSDYQNTGLACSTTMRDPYNLIWVPLYADDGTRNGISMNSDNTAYLYPIPVDQDSVYAKLVFNNAKDNAQQLMVNFDFISDFRDSTINMIPCSSFTDWMPSMIRGLIDVCPVFSDIEESGVTVTLQTSDGNAVNATLAQGILPAPRSVFEWTFTDITQNTTPTFTITESAPGVYSVFYGTPADPGDVFRVDILNADGESLFNGFDFTCVAASTYVTPLS